MKTFLPGLVSVLFLCLCWRCLLNCVWSVTVWCLVVLVGLFEFMKDVRLILGLKYWIHFVVLMKFMYNSIEIDVFLIKFCCIY
jgi:hypothetical protein